MVPISRRKQVAGMVGALALGYSLSWLVAPGPGTGPVEHFGPTFGQSAPVVVAPAPPVEASQPVTAAPEPLQSPRYQPI